MRSQRKGVISNSNIKASEQLSQIGVPNNVTCLLGCAISTV